MTKNSGQGHGQFPNPQVLEGVQKWQLYRVMQTNCKDTESWRLAMVPFLSIVFIVLSTWVFPFSTISLPTHFSTFQVI